MFTVYLHAYIETKPRVNSFTEQTKVDKHEIRMTPV